MPKNYENVSMDELRELLLNGELVHEKMHEEDYVIMIDNELDLDEPSNEVIRLCTSALKKYDSYKELANIKIDIDALIKRHNDEESAPKRRRRKKAILIAAAVIAALLTVQIVSAAMGHSLLGYVFARHGEILSIKHDEKLDEPEELFDEPIHTTYESMNDMPDNILAFVPPNLLEGFEYFFGSTVFYSPNQFHAMFAFLHTSSDDVFLMFDIKRIDSEVRMPIDEDFFEEYTANEIRYSIYQNLEIYRVVWIDNDVLYSIGVNLPLDEVKEIIEKL
jgi:hypothetical protein